MPRVALLPLLLTAALVAGCDLVGGGGPTRAEGVVVDAQTGAPIPGIDVSFRTGGGFGVYPAVATDRTDAEGRFALASDARDAGAVGLTLSANDCAYEQPGCRYDARYGSAFPAGGVEHGREARGLRIELIPVQP